MASEEEKKKFLTDQMKGMLGPCMITFAIPLTIPGLTLTLVVFSGDKTFPKYGALHVTGLIFLGVSIILIILGCIFRFMWKPKMDPEVLRHLTPANSMRLRKKDVESGKRVRTLNGIYKGDSPRPNDNNICIDTNITQETNDLQNKEIPQNANISLTMNRLPEAEQDVKGMTKKESKSNIPYESEESDACSGDSLRRKPHRMESPRHSRHLAPLIKTNEQQRPDSPMGKIPPSYDEIQKWRHKRKKKSEFRSETGFGVDNYGSECDEENSEKFKQQYTSETEDGEIVRHNSLVTTKGSVATENQSNRRKKKKKKKALKAKHDITEQTTGENKAEGPVLKSFSRRTSDSRDTDIPIQTSSKTSDSLFKNEAASDDSDASIGSADSVLAQYTSRTQND